MEGVGDGHADGIRQPPVRSRKPVEEGVSPAGGVGADQCLPSVSERYGELGQGEPGGFDVIARGVGTRVAGPQQGGHRLPGPVLARPPTVRQVTSWITRHPTALNDEDRVGLKNLLTRCPELDTAAGHVREFGEILTGRLGTTLPAWIDAVDASQLPGLTGFALHLLRDLDAVTAGLTLDWSSGSIEGAVNRIKKNQETALRPSRIRTPTQDDLASVVHRSGAGSQIPSP